MLICMCNLIEQKKRSPKRVVIITMTVLFAIIMAQIGVGWYVNDLVYIKFGSTRESMYNATTSTFSPGLHLFSNVLFFGGLITVDFLMVRWGFSSIDHANVF